MSENRDRQSGYDTTELAAVYDAVHAQRDDASFWRSMAEAAGGGPVLELGCGTGRVLLPLARSGRHVTGLDRSTSMLDVCRDKLRREPPEVRERVRLVAADMASFDLGRSFPLVTVPFASFQHLLTVEQQLACLACCLEHLRPSGRLVLDLPNPDPAPAGSFDAAPVIGEAAAELVGWTDGRQIRWWSSVTDSQPSRQCYTFEVTYEVMAPSGRHRLTDTLRLRYVFRYELEHLLVRAGFRTVTLFGDYDRSPYEDASPAMIVVAAPA